MSESNVPYFGYTIQPKRDFGKLPFLINGRMVSSGWVVTDGICNVLPGATWAETIDQAKQLVRMYIQADYNADLFWQLVKAKKWEP